MRDPSSTESIEELMEWMRSTVCVPAVTGTITEELQLEYHNRAGDYPVRESPFRPDRRLTIDVKPAADKGSVRG